MHRGVAWKLIRREQSGTNWSARKNTIVASRGARTTVGGLTVNARQIVSATTKSAKQIVSGATRSGTTASYD